VLSSSGAEAARASEGEIAYVVSVRGDREIFLMNADGSERNICKILAA
jgi:hypothetical protein